MVVAGILAALGLYASARTAGMPSPFAKLTPCGNGEHDDDVIEDDGARVVVRCKRCGKQRTGVA